MMQNAKYVSDPKNPHGLGDPLDKTLLNIEKEVLIPKIMRDHAKTNRCVNEVKEFKSCCKASDVLMVVSCGMENSALKSCLTKCYEDEQFKEECKQIYLQERSEYRRTGIPKKHRAEKM